MEYKYVFIEKDTKKRMVLSAKAPNAMALATRLKGQGIIPLKIYEVQSQKGLGILKRVGLVKKVSGKELAIFTRQLATTLKAGLLLTEAIETITEDLENPYFAAVLKKLVEDIRGGASFSAALSRYNKVFPATFVAIISAGEATGRLDETTTKLAEYLEASERLKEKVKSALTYPSFVVGFAFVVIGVMVFFLIPKFQSTFESFHAKLPLLTRIVMGISKFCTHNFLWILLFFLGLGVLYFVLEKNPKTKVGVDAAKLKIPLLGKSVIQKALVARFCRTLGFLMASGVSLPKSLEITSAVLDHSQMVDAIEYIKMRVMTGSMMSDEIRTQPIFPKLVSKMASVGERAGQIPSMFLQTADYYDNELEHSIQRMTTLLEPILIVFIGVNVLIVVLALYLPIFQMAVIIK